jgi:thiol-disulfide isomerase/thioredoxin
MRELPAYRTGRHPIPLKTFNFNWMKKVVLFCIVLTYFSAVAYAQRTIIGSFTSLSNQQIKLVGFEGFNTYVIDSVKVSEKGTFRLSFNVKDIGMGYLAAEDNKPFIVILSGDEEIMLEGKELALPETVVITSGKQNQLFGQYAVQHPRREQALSAWIFLNRIYQQDSLFAVYNAPGNAIKKEIQRIKDEDKAFLKSLDPQTYLGWFLPVRKLISSVTTIAQYRTEEIPDAIASFRNMDYTDPRLYKSGLLRETIEKHFWLIENSGRSLDSVYIEMNISIDYMIENLVTDEKKLNKITEYLFRLLEQRSLFGASEYLALKVLNEVSCTIDSNLAAQLESYRAMKIGKRSPDFVFKEGYFAPGYEPVNYPQKLSDIKSKYTVIVFGSSWCPQCSKELSQIVSLYEKWKTQDVEVVFVSLDEDKQTFKNYVEGFPFISICDYRKWESPVVKDYHVFATPTIYLLDHMREILLRPHSVNQLDSWIDWYLVQGKR